MNVERMTETAFLTLDVAQPEMKKNYSNTCNKRKQNVTDGITDPYEGEQTMAPPVSLFDHCVRREPSRKLSYAQAEFVLHMSIR